MAKAPVPPPKPVAFPFTHPLKKPIDDPATAGHKLTQIKMREPTTGDMLKHGFLDGAINGQAMLDCIADLSGLAPPTLEFLHPADYFALSKAVSVFFDQAAA